jgi:hypothetical protein
MFTTAISEPTITQPTITSRRRSRRYGTAQYWSVGEDESDVLAARGDALNVTEAGVLEHHISS